jgi:F-type H+-transporting ATPase subunit a
MIAVLCTTSREIFSIVHYVVLKLGLPESWAGQYVDVVLSIFITIILTIVALFVWRRIRRAEEGLLPDGRITVTNMLEMTVEAVLKLMGDVMGPENARRHLPLIAPLFIYILVSNLLGVIPGFYSPTQNINTNLACALVVFFYYNYCGIRDVGFVRYFKRMAGPIIWMAPLMLAIEIVSHIVRPVSLSVRLLGNIAGDHMVLDIFSGLVPLFLPVIFMGLAIFIAILQAFVFTLLSIIYIQMASATE